MPARCSANIILAIPTNNKYGGNPYYSGNLFSALDPNGTDQSLKYIQMDLRPCTLANASLLGMQCSSDCTQFFANPHAMVEPMDDMAAFKTKCNGLTSFNHSGNDSNFIFAALEWANNMLQSWSEDPEETLNTDGDSW